MMGSFISEHNAMRSKYGLSQAFWDSKVASTSETQSDTCDLSSINQSVYGVNTYATIGGTVSTSDSVEAVGGWNSEEKNYNCTSGICDSQKTCGNFTQVTWSTSTSVGCAITICPESSSPFFPSQTGSWKFIVCKYNDRGNTGGRPFPVENCPSGSTQSAATTSQAPSTLAATTTKTPTTVAATTNAPTTAVSTTKAPTTSSPTSTSASTATSASTSTVDHSTTFSPSTTLAPTTAAATATGSPTTNAATNAITTKNPTVESTTTPSTEAPTVLESTQAPSTSPTTENPTVESTTTPSTEAPTTEASTTESPETQPATDAPSSDTPSESNDSPATSAPSFVANSEVKATLVVGGIVTVSEAQTGLENALNAKGRVEVHNVIVTKRAETSTIDFSLWDLPSSATSSSTLLKNLQEIVSNNPSALPFNGPFNLQVPPTVNSVSSTPSSAQNQQESAKPSNRPSWLTTGAIVGIAVGGAVLLAIIVAVVIVVIVKRKKDPLTSTMDFPMQLRD
eukprot:TRINITY_DN581_c0_g1_i6.p1 TRINITY_DN581_c0_g1~~TRINITY_DN581_c0_g1_i6.p1  ORF type:complete len:510 (-),score=153.05 TRINITY_DN581_c0_g1_i6:278-1807(-)